MKPTENIGNAVIYLLGVPAVGKHTIAREFGRLTGARIVDNQLINLPVFSVVAYDGKDSFDFPPEAWRHVETIRSAVFAVARECVPTDVGFVFTSVPGAGVPAREQAVFRSVEEIAADREAPFLPVWLSCSAEETRKRKSAPDRRERFKDTDLTNVDRHAHEFDGFRVEHPNALSLETTTLRPEAVARRIIQAVREEARK